MISFHKCSKNDGDCSACGDDPVWYLGMGIMLHSMSTERLYLCEKCRRLLLKKINKRTKNA